MGYWFTMDSGWWNFVVSFLPQPTTQLIRSAFFQCTHFYKIDSWSDEQNRAEFGLCFHPQGHGHTYKVDLYLQGPVDPTTGMILNLRDVDLGMKRVLAALDQKHLNFDIAEFKDKIPTTENIAKYLFDLFAKEVHSPTCSVVRVRLYETDDLWVDYGHDHF